MVEYPVVYSFNFFVFLKVKAESFLNAIDALIYIIIDYGGFCPQFFIFLKLNAKQIYFKHENVAASFFVCLFFRGRGG